MAKRSRRRTEKPATPTSVYTDADGNSITLRGALKPASRMKYAQILAGSERPAATREDAWHRAVEFLFEHLALRWEIAGAPVERQKELLGRFRAASSSERAWIRDVLREHCVEHFPDVQAP